MPKNKYIHLIVSHKLVTMLSGIIGRVSAVLVSFFNLGCTGADRDL